MADNNNFTIWQRLTKVFGPDSTLDQQAPVYNFDKKQILKTTDKKEYEREKLQAQQTLYLGQQWQKIENNLYTQAVYYEPTRLASFYDYESMEYTPEISAALDIYSEESTTPDEDGYILQIYSESKRIKSVLADLFNNRLDINTNLPMWTRNTCKYGDNFVYLKLDPEKGIMYEDFDMIGYQKELKALQKERAVLNKKLQQLKSNENQRLREINDDSVVKELQKLHLI